MCIPVSQPNGNSSFFWLRLDNANVDALASRDKSQSTQVGAKLETAHALTDVRQAPHALIELGQAPHALIKLGQAPHALIQLGQASRALIGSGKAPQPLIEARSLVDLSLTRSMT